MTYDALLDSVGHAIAGGSSNLSSLLGVEVDFVHPTLLEAIPGFEAKGERIVTVTVSFTEGITGTTTLVFTSDEARQMVEVMLAGMDYGEDDIFGELGLSALGEAMNQFVAGIGRRLGEQKGYLVNISTPRVEIVDANLATTEPTESEIIVALDGSIGPTPGRLYWTMSQEVVDALLPTADAATTSTDPTGEPVAPPGDAASSPPPPSSPPPTSPSSASPSPTSPSGALAPLGHSELGRLADVMLDVTVELGRSRIPIRELLALDEGGVIRLGRPVGEPVDLLVNGLTTARGEIVVVDGRLGLRVTELIA